MARAALTLDLPHSPPYTSTAMIDMPIRRYLQEDFNQQVNNAGLDPFEAYTKLVEGLRARKLAYDTYAQATITSGGHARNPNLDWIEIVTRNVAYAQGMAVELYGNGQLNPRRTIEASTLGLVSHWQEKDYITFWFNTLARPATGNGTFGTDRLRQLVEQNVDKFDIDFTKFNDYSLTNDQRAEHYMAYADAAAKAVKVFGDFDRVDRLVAVSETAGSLGASTERYFTKKLGGSVYNLAIANFQSLSTTGSFTNPSLVKDTDELVRYGAHIFDPRTGEQIVLVREDS